MKAKTIYISLLLLFIGLSGKSQQLTGNSLLDKAIAYHDPTDTWNNFQGNFNVTMSTPDGKDRVSNISIDLQSEYFQLVTTKNNTTLKQTLTKGVCELMLNESKDISEEDRKTHRLTCERAMMYKNYYTYLYGLPMKLKDPGTNIDPKIEKKTFKGKEYLTLKVTYDKTVGNDTWYFYFDPETFAMEVYQFFHDESENDGEYILLTGEESISGIKMPKTRAWYYNKDDKYLGTDVLSKTSNSPK